LWLWRPRWEWHRCRCRCRCHSAELPPPPTRPPGARAQRAGGARGQHLQDRRGPAVLLPAAGRGHGGGGARLLLCSGPTRLRLLAHPAGIARVQGRGRGLHASPGSVPANLAAGWAGR
jgi:hypothetical protein